MTIWTPLSALQDLINNSGFSGVDLQDLTLAFVTETGFSREGIFTEYDESTMEQITRVTHLSDLVGINQDQVGLPPEAVIESLW